MATFVTADTHFNHQSILGYTERPWPDVAAMNEGLIAAWNGTVKKGDTVFVCGDFGFRERDGLPTLAEIFVRLNGTKHLVRGNHDAAPVTRLGWETVSEIKTIRWGTGRAVCCHFPMLVWDNAARGYLMLHGHCHGNLRGGDRERRFDVGVDAMGREFGYAPVPTDHLDKLAGKRKFHALDHHRAA